jgi:hypothetical protein
VAVRAGLVWAFFRGASASALAQAGDVPPREALVGTPEAAVLLCLAVIVVMRVELARRSELLFLANLGCSFRRVALFVALECFVLESLLRMAVG